MLPNGRRLGAHLPLGNGMVKAADRAAEIGASAIQVFTDNPTSWRRRHGLPGELPAFRDRLAEHGIAPLAVHAPYLVNLAGPDPELHQRSVASSSTSCAWRRRTGHRSSTSTSVRTADRTDGRDRSARRRLRLSTCGRRAAPGVLLVLENGAGGGFGLGASMEELGEIDTAVAAAGVDRARFGFCLDTAHLWGAGYPIDTAAGRGWTCWAASIGSWASTGCTWCISTTLDRSSDPGWTATSTWAPDGGRCRAGTHGHPPRPCPRRLLPRDAGDGRWLRRGEHRAAAGPGRGPPAGGSAAGGIRDPQRAGAQRPRGRRRRAPAR